MLAYKLLRVRQDGSLGSLFIDKTVKIERGKWLEAKDVPTRGYAHRPGWHVTEAPHAPHLSTKGREWYAVLVKDETAHERPVKQGGMWYTAPEMKVLYHVPKMHCEAEAVYALAVNYGLTESYVESDNGFFIEVDGSRLSHMSEIVENRRYFLVLHGGWKPIREISEIEYRDEHRKVEAIERADRDIR